MPSGSSPDDAQAYYDYLQGHHIVDGRVATWTPDWLAIAWLWGFVIALTIGIVYWVRQYRTTRQRPSLYLPDVFGGYTTESAGPATVFFVLLTIGLVAFAVAIVVGHLVYGQKF